MSPSEIFLPRTLPFPIKVLSYNVKPHEQVTRKATLLNYSFTFQPARNVPVETRFGTWESHVEGTLEEWLVKPGQVILRDHGPAVLITEPCKHPVQSFGLCGICGKDMTETDYTGYVDVERASIQMDYIAGGPTLSFEEATRLERETSERLLKSRKLHLIVDLDQTIVHATVDPTVGEWMSEGKSNPNWEALEDVKKFQLGDTFNGKVHEPADGCWYYIKPRPGLSSFLTDLAEKYEMHVYTMGTRAYADQVCKTIDPTGKIFAGRILSRDESGSMTKKRLHRLFPSDQSMVVVIDDRADMWDWSANLVKVIPYEFFVGIGDINSAFLPNVEPLIGGVSSATPPIPEPTASIPPSKPSIPTPLPPSSPPIVSTSDSTEDDVSEDPATLLSKQSRELESQLEDRPLAKKQEELTHTESTTNDQDSGIRTQKALLNNDDQELDRVKDILYQIHGQFYHAYDRLHSKQRTETTTSKTRGPGVQVPIGMPDVRVIIPKRMAETFQGMHLVFSSVIPLGTNPDQSDIWRMARMFGAECHAEVSKKVTHVVAAKRGTVKVDEASTYPTINVVWLKWFTDSVAQWRSQRESAYLLDPLTPGSPRNGVKSIAVPSSAMHPGPPQGLGLGLDVKSGLEDRHLGRHPPQYLPPVSRPELQLPSSDDSQLDYDLIREHIDGVEAATHLDVSWSEMDAEVDAYLAMDSEDEEGTDQNASPKGSSSTPGLLFSSSPVPPKARGLKRVRSRSGTPPSGSGDDSELLRSPLAKRKKVVADRPPSMLKMEISAKDLAPSAIPTKITSSPSSVASSSQLGDEERPTELEKAGDEDDYEDDDDDFLLRDLEEEGWG